MTIISLITLLMLFVVIWGTMVKCAGHPVVSGKSNQIIILPWTTFHAVVVYGVHVHFHYRTIVVTVKTCFYSVKELVSPSYKYVSTF